MHRCFAALLLATLFVGAARADTLNYDPDSVPPVPILDAGWTYDQIDFAFNNSLDSPYVYALAAPAYFRITDQFVTGDTLYVFDFGLPILTTSLSGAQSALMPVGDGTGQSGWTSAAYEHGQILLAAGAHSLTVQGNGAGGLSAGFYTRLDSAAAVPTPSAIVALIGMGMVGLVGVVRRRKK